MTVSYTHLDVYKRQVITGGGGFVTMRIGRPEIDGARMHGPVGRGEEHFTLIRAAGAAHVRHAEALDVGLRIVVAVAMVFRVGAELHHAEGHGRSGKEIDSSAGSFARADEWVDAGGRSYRRRGLCRQSVQAKA